jgi:NAD(P)-dependent dehydrogenase (short-subunit alcohol dehydrogenase family)
VLLEDKNAVIYGGGGTIGGAVARAFAREGARVFLAGRTLTKLDDVAEEIRSVGGVAETAQVDALDGRASMSTPMPWPRAPEVSTSPSTSSRTTKCTGLLWSRCTSRTTPVRS